MTFLRGTHHVAIICSHYERSKEFYTKVLGLEILRETYRAERQSYKLDLRLPDQSQIELFSFPDPPLRASYPEAQGLRHLAFRVENLEQAASRLQSFSVSHQEIRLDEHSKQRFVFFEDPDGLPLELYEEPMGAGMSYSDELSYQSFFEDVSLLRGHNPGDRPWALLASLSSWVEEQVRTMGSCGDISEVYIHPSARVEPGVQLKGPIFISAGCFIASGVLLRGGVYLGENTSVGPSCEVKSSVILKSTALAHFNFIADSIIGSHVNFEAGAHTANHWNEREDKSISVWTKQGVIPTGLTKFGGIIGDRSRIGANSVLSPGTILPRACIVPRLTLVEQGRT